ncbi:MAG TPA: hypothetical protein PLW65_18765 [Pseudomonadota bacterium]|nr:hypothetical protein [Pseudomonadota bacterium]
MDLDSPCLGVESSRPRRRAGLALLMLAALWTGATGCATGRGRAAPAPAPAAVQPWPSDAVFAGFPVLHCSREEFSRAFLTDLKQRGGDEQTAKELYLTTRDAVLGTMNLFLATGSWAGKMVHITPTREQPRQGGPPECRMFELALADEIEVRLPKSWSAAPYLAPIAMVGYDFEPATGPDTVPRIAVRVAALLARGDGKVLRTISTVARADYATRVPVYQERTSQEVAQELTEQIARGLSQNLRSDASSTPGKR